MKQRVITGLLAALFGITVLSLMFTPVLGIVLAAVSFIASYEIQHVAKIKNKLLMIINMIVAAFMPVALEYKLFEKLPFPTYIVAIVYVILMMFIMLGNYAKTKFEDVVMSMFCGVIVPYVMTTIILIRDLCLSRPDLFQQSQVFFYYLYGAAVRMAQRHVCVFCRQQVRKAQARSEHQPQKEC